MEPLDTCRSCCHQRMQYLLSNLGNSRKTTVISTNRTAKGGFFFLVLILHFSFLLMTLVWCSCSAYEQTGEQSLLQYLVYPCCSCCQVGWDLEDTVWFAWCFSEGKLRSHAMHPDPSFASIFFFPGSYLGIFYFVNISQGPAGLWCYMRLP